MSGGRSELDPNAPLGGRYRPIRRVGGGSMGEVFEAEDLMLGRRVALKLSHASDPATRALFLDEARLAARLTHPNLVAIYDVGVADETAFIVMELVQGIPLLAWLRRGPVDWMVVASIALGASAGLAALHEAGLVHRDIKPANLMIDARGVVKVVDFGIAVSEGHISERHVVGSPGYMAPEVVLGAPVRRAVDVFGLGVVMHELATGARLFDGETAIERMLAVTQGTAPRLTGSRTPHWLADLVEACLAPDPAARLPHAGHVHALLRSREPFADLAEIARRWARDAEATPPEQALDEPTAGAHGPSPLLGRQPLLDAVLSALHPVWLHGPPGIGKSRIASELAASVDAGSVLVLEHVRHRSALAEALGLESDGDADAVRDALEASAPVLVILDDAESHEEALYIVERIATEIPDARIVVTARTAPSAAVGLEVMRVPPLALEDVARMLASSGLHDVVIRHLAELTEGNPLAVELVMRLIPTGNTTDLRAGHVLRTLLERVLFALPPSARHLAELESVSPSPRDALLRLDDEPAFEAAKKAWGAAGVLARSESGARLHDAFREVVAQRLLQDGRAELLKRERRDLLARRIRALVVEAESQEPARALRQLVMLRSEVLGEAERALEGGLDDLERAVEHLIAVVHPTLPKFEEAIPLCERLLAALQRLGAGTLALGWAHLANAWARVDDLPGSLLHAREAIACGPGPFVPAAMTVRGSVEKRLGHTAETERAFEALREHARGTPYEVLAVWELLLIAVRRGEHERARAAMLQTLPPLGRHGPRVMLLRALVASELADTDTFLEASEGSIARALALGQTRFAAIGLNYAIEARILRGELTIAEIAGRQAVLIARAANLSLALGHTLRLIAVIRLLSDRPLEAHPADSSQRAATLATEALTRGTSHVPTHAMGRVLVAVARAISGAEGTAAILEQARREASAVPSMARTVEVYALFVEALLGDLDATDRLDAMLGAPDPGASSETRLALVVVGRLRAQILPRPTWVGHG